MPNDPLPQARQLSRLPPFFYGRHDNDKYGGYRGRNHAAVIFADKKDGNNAVFGTFGTASAFQFSSKPFTTCPTFGILVRAGYRTSADSGRFARKADNPKPRIRMYVSESSSRDPNHMSEDFDQDSLEFDCDFADWFTSEIVETLPHDVKSRIEQSGITMKTGRSVCYGMLVYQTAKHEPAVRVYGQPKDFEPGTPQHKFFEHVSNGTVRYTIITELKYVPHKQMDKQTLKDGNHYTTCETFNLLVNHISGMTYDGRPGNDWYFRREPGYASRGFAVYTVSPENSLPVVPWLQTGRDGKVNQAFPSQMDLRRRSMPRKAFASLSEYKYLFTAALLYEQDQEVQQTAHAYNRDRQHFVEFERAVGDEYFIFINVVINRHGLNGDAVLPFNAKVTLDAIENIDCNEPSDAIAGFPSDITRDGFDFTIRATVKKRVAEQLKEARRYHVVISLCYENSDMKRKLLAFCRLNTPKRRQESANESIVDGKKRGTFELGSVLFEQERHVFSPNFILNQAAKEEIIEATVEAKIKRLMRRCHLNEQQRLFVDTYARRGVSSCLTILEGLPGTGKSLTLALLIYVLQEMDQRIIGEAHSNAAVQALYDKVNNLIEQELGEQDESLKSKIIHIHNRTKENRFRERLEGLNPESVPKDCLSARIIEYVRTSPNDNLVKEYKQRKNMDDDQKEGKKKRKMTSIIRDLTTRVCKDSKIIFCTTAVATTLHETGFKATVVILDEAAQVSEPDAIASVMEQRDIALVMLAGDEMQLPPVIKSATSQTNPLSDLL